VKKAEDFKIVKFMKENTETSAFDQACVRAGIPATKRQASKWLHKKGLAFKIGGR